MNQANSFLYSLNSSTIRPTPLIKKIKVASAAGYSGIELWHDDLYTFIEQGGRLRDVRNALDDYGLAVPTTIYLGDWFDAPPERYDPALDECKRRMDQAAEVGAPFIIAGPPAGRADYQLGAQRYRELLEIGRSMGVKPAMEFLGFVEQLNTIEEALQVMELCGHADATTVLDPFHIWRGGGDVESIAKLKHHQIAVCHFNDTVKEPPREQQHDPDRVMPGDGSFDLQRYIELLRQVGYQRWLSLELFREDLWAKDPLDVANEGLQKMTTVLLES